MTSIRSFSEILLGDWAVSEHERQRFVRIIHDESLRLTRLLDEILDISRLEPDTTELPIGPLDPEAIITAALDTISGLAQKNGITIRREAVPEGVRVSAVEDRLRQVLINLLSNAVKYNAAEAPEILVRPGLAEGALWIDVIDNGGGVGPDEARTVFEKFTRGSRAARGQGAGLGLPISRALMRRMGGDLTVEFDGDESSFFRLSLALASRG